MSSTRLARDHRDPLAARTLPRHGNGARRAHSLARGGGALNRSAFGGGPRVSQETRGKLRSWGGRAAGRGGHLEGPGCSVHGSEGLERNVEPRQNSSRPVVQSGDTRLCGTGVRSGAGTACQQWQGLSIGTGRLLGQDAPPTHTHTHQKFPNPGRPTSLTP